MGTYVCLEVRVRERVFHCDALLRVEDEHLLKQVERLRVITPQLLAERLPLALRERLYEPQSLERYDQSAFLNAGWRALTFSLQIVSMTSSGGVPSNSVMIENWLTSSNR